MLPSDHETEANREQHRHTRLRAGSRLGLAPSTPRGAAASRLSSGSEEEGCI